MTVSAGDILNASILSDAAYKNSAALITFLSGSIWQPLGSNELPRPASLSILQSWDSYFGEGFGDSNFLFDNGNVQAIVARNQADNSIAIAFRGSNSISDLSQDIFHGESSFRPEYDQFRLLVESLDRYISANQITKVLVTGHSLGGVMAEWYMLDHHSAGINYVGVTFGSPGDVSLSGVKDSRLINLGHSQDPVFNSAVDWKMDGGDINVDLTYSNGTTQDALGLLDLSQNALLFANLGEHDLTTLYSSTAEALFSSSAFSEFIANPTKYSVVIGSGSATIGDSLNGLNGVSDFILGRSGDDRLNGYSGDDLLDGGAGNDTLTGGPGNDVIFGGDGIDTVVYALAWNRYTISIQNNRIVISPILTASQMEGADTVNNDVEYFQFSDGTRARFELFAPLDPTPTDTTPPQLTGRSPSDNTTGVSITTSFSLTFNETVVKGIGNIDIHKSDGSLYQRISIADASHVAFSGATLLISPTFNLVAGTGYYLNIDSGAILDRSGNAFAGISNQTDYNFTTTAAAPTGDTAPPVLTIKSPSDNSFNVAVGSDFTLTFNEIVLPNAGNIDIHRLDGSVFRSVSILDASQVTFSGNTITIAPSVDLAPGSDYYITVAAGAIRDVSGNLFGGISSSTDFNFTTASAPQLPTADDTGIFLSIVDNSINEGASGDQRILSFGVNLTGPGAGTQTVSIQYTTEDIPGGSANATSGSDYIFTSGVLVIPAGQTFGQIDVKVIGDNQLEQDEVFRLALSQPSSGVTLLRDFGTGFINNDDQAPNHPPVTGYDLAITAPGTPVLMNLLANDSDPDGDTLHLDQIFRTSTGATYVLQGDKVLVTPDAGFTGVLSFQYVVRDTPNSLFNSTYLAQVIVAGDGTPGVTDPGTIGDDIIVGTGGNDTLSGGFGDDVIAGGPGGDRIDGGAGFDYLDLRQAAHGANIQFRDPWTWDDGDGGQDLLTNIEGVLGSPYRDLVDAAFGSVAQISTGFRFYGNDGDDRLRTGSGDDILDGGAGNDELIFGSGRDIVFGGPGNDVIYSFDGSSDTVGDVLDGGPGDDNISSSLGASADLVYGGDGNDNLSFSNGDIVSGGPGSDSFFVSGYNSANPYHATITDLAPGDVIKWQFQNATITDNHAYYFIGPITGGSGASTVQNHVEFSSADGQTTLYFGFDTTPGADSVLSINGTFRLGQFQVDDSDFTLAIKVLSAAANNDFNGDGKSDIFWRKDNGDTFVWTMNGLQSGAQGGLGTVDTIWHVDGTGDFDGDGKSDLLWRSEAGNLAIWTMNGTQKKGEANLARVDTHWQIAGTGDFNGDGKSDILWRNNNGDVFIYTMNGTQILAQGGLGNVDTRWQIAGTGDFDGDGKSDILWRNTNGATLIWTMNGIGKKAEGSLGNVDIHWHVAGTGDFDGDGKSDILWRNDNGDMYAYAMNGLQIKAQGGLGNVNSHWDVAATGDYDGDGKSDILWRNDNGSTLVWTMNGLSKKTEGNVGGVDTHWHIQDDGSQTAPHWLGDLDADGKSDLLFRNNNGDVYVWEMNGLAKKAEASLGNVDGAWHIAGNGDFDGDGKSDIFWRNDNGAALVWEMNGFAKKTEGGLGAVDTRWAVAATGDFDGDGKSDVLWHHDNGSVLVWEMNGLAKKAEGSLGNVDAHWQIAGSGDFDGDGKSDLLWRNDNGGVFIWEMNGLTKKAEGSLGMIDTAWHVAGTGDFDADGKSDILWRNDSGEAFMWEMNGLTKKAEGSLGTVDLHWDIVATGDVDTDQKADIVWRHDNGNVAIWEMNGFQIKAEAGLGQVDTGWHVT